MQDREKRRIIGVSACWLHGDADRELYDGRSLLYMEQSMGEWILGHGAGLPVMIPDSRPGRPTALGAADFADMIDGLIVQGGVDVAPETYGEEPIKPEWAGDAVRDASELDLIQACLERDRPILGVCRGHQVLNVALGGSLYQDIGTEVDGALKHRDPVSYHENIHEVVFESGAKFRQMYAADHGMINSVHHQAIRKVGDGLRIEARSPKDGIIEAVRLHGDRYAVGVQWHPEFQEPGQHQLVPIGPLLDDFFEAIDRRKRQR